MSTQEAVRPATTTMWATTVLAVVGSVCGTLVTGALGASPTMKLVGAALGAALPPTISAAGPYHRTRATMGLLVTAAALLLTYGGFTLLDYAAERPSTFPLPEQAPDPGGEVSTEAGGLGIEVTPSDLHCTALECERPVTIRSTGSEPLRITTIEFDGEAAASFRHAGECEGLELQTDEECDLTVRFTPSGSGEVELARLVIHQNLPGAPTFVALEGEPSDPGDPGDPGDPAAADLVASPDNAECVHQRAGAADGRDALQVFFHVLLIGATPDELPGLVHVTARSDTGLAVDFRSSVSNQAQTVAALPLESSDYGRTHVIVVQVDPENEVDEQDEDNNRIRITVTLPAQVAATQTLPCGVEAA